MNQQTATIETNEREKIIEVDLTNYDKLRESCMTVGRLIQDDNYEIASVLKIGDDDRYEVILAKKE